MNYAHHLDLDAEKIAHARIALLPGDPDRVPTISAHLQNSRDIGQKREFRSAIGALNNTDVAVVSTGCGAPSTTICVEELAQIGVRDFIRIGTTGSIQESIDIGDLIISSGAVRREGASQSYAPIEYPAVPNFEITGALLQAARDSGHPHHLGIGATTDNFYQGQERYASFSGYVPQHLQGSTEELRRLRVTNYEMEASALFVMCSAMGLRAGAIFAVVAKRMDSEQIAPKKQFALAEEAAISVAIAAVAKLEQER